MIDKNTSSTLFMDRYGFSDVQRTCAIDPAIWLALELGRPIEDELHCRVALPRVCNGLYCGMDAKRSRFFVVPIDDDNVYFESGDISGLNVEIRMLTQEFRLERYIAIKCENARNHDFFDLLGVALAHELKSEERPSNIVRRELGRWRRFWSDLPSPVLSWEEQLGLFAELWFMCTWLYPRIGAALAIARWRGPFGGRHDFEWPARGVEVKGTASQRGRVHHINGIDQLKAPEDGRLFLFSVKLRETASAHNSLPLLIEACRQPILNDPDALSLFENALARFGYSDSHAAVYASLTLEVTGEMLFEVTESFPKITSETIGTASLAGIEYVEYDLNLTGFEHLAMTAEPAILDAIR